VWDNRRNDDRRNIIKKLVSSSRGGCGEAKGKVDSSKITWRSRNNDALSGNVHAAITLMMR
jgi:hypothetical protein